MPCITQHIRSFLSGSSLTNQHYPNEKNAHSYQLQTTSNNDPIPPPPYSSSPSDQSPKPFILEFQPPSQQGYRVSLPSNNNNQRFLYRPAWLSDTSTGDKFETCYPQKALQWIIPRTKWYPSARLGREFGRKMVDETGRSSQISSDRRVTQPGPGNRLVTWYYTYVSRTGLKVSRLNSDVHHHLLQQRLNLLVPNKLCWRQVQVVNHHVH
jgi:hypothetical protein